MKVSELIKKLQTFDPRLDVLCYTEDEDLISQDHILRILEIEDIQITDCERKRSEDGIPTIKLGKSALSEKIVFLNVISQF